MLYAEIPREGGMPWWGRAGSTQGSARVGQEAERVRGDMVQSLYRGFHRKERAGRVSRLRTGYFE